MSLSADSSNAQYGGVYPAKVYATNDPNHSGRIQMYIPQIFGTMPVQIWAPPCVPGGSVPVVGSIVWCLFQGGDPAYPTYLPQLVSVKMMAYRSAPFDIVTGGANVIYDTVIVDTADGLNTGTGRYTFPSTAQYLVAAAVGITPGSTAGHVWAYLRQNTDLFGTLYGPTLPYLGAGTYASAPVSGFINAQAGDTLSLGYQSSAAIVGGGNANSVQTFMHLASV